MIRVLFHGGPLHDQERRLAKPEDYISVLNFAASGAPPARQSAQTDPDAPLVGPYRLVCDPPETFDDRRRCVLKETVIYQLHWINLGHDEGLLPVYVIENGLPLAERYVRLFTATLHALPGCFTTNRFWLARSLDRAHGEFQNSLVEFALRFRPPQH